MKICIHDCDSDGSLTSTYDYPLYIYCKIIYKIKYLRIYNEGKYFSDMYEGI